MNTNRLLIVTLLAATTGCVTDGAMGEPGKMGEPGETGNAGKRGERLVWKDGGGMTVNGSYVFHHVDGGLANLTMLVLHDDVLYEINPLNGELTYTYVATTLLPRYFQTTNCSGPAFYVPSVTTPGLAFRLNNRVVALPSDIPIGDTMGSYYGNGGCYRVASVKGVYLPAAMFDELPTLTPPDVGPGPFHVGES